MSTTVVGAIAVDTWLETVLRRIPSGIIEDLCYESIVVHGYAPHDLMWGLHDAAIQHCEGVIDIPRDVEIFGEDILDYFGIEEDFEGMDGNDYREALTRLYQLHQQLV